MKYWNEFTWKEIEALPKDTLLVLPLGSTEQHGERMPLGTDHFLAEAWADRVFPGDSPNVLLLPTLPYGMAWHHTKFPGTISIDASVYTMVLRNILESIARTGFRRILIVNGHGGNHKWIEQAIAETQEVYPNLRVANPTVPLVESDEFKQTFEPLFGEKVVHAGAMEASMIADVFPESLRDVGVVTHVPKDAVWGEGANSPSVWKQKFPMGQKGDQRQADADKGSQINKFTVEKIREAAAKI